MPDATTLDEKLAAVRDRTSHLLAAASPSPDLMRANMDVHHAVAVLLARHEPQGYYAGADDCGHPEPEDRESPDARTWHEWDADHPYGTNDNGRICKLTQTDSYCPACTVLAYGDEPSGDDYVSARDCIVRPLFEQVVMGEREPSAV